MQLNTEMVTTKTFILKLTESELATVASGLRKIVNSLDDSTMATVAKIMLAEINKKLPSQYKQLEFDYEKTGKYYEWKRNK